MSFLNSKYNNLVPYKPGEQLKANNLIKLNTNENPYPPSKMVIEAIQVESGKLNRYSDPDCTELTNALAKHYNLQSNQVFIGNGSDEVLSFIFQGLTEDGIYYPDITYGFYKVYQDFYQLKGGEVPLNQDLKLVLNDYPIEGTILFANPNAPTAYAIDPKEILSFAKERKNQLIVVDEAYADFSTSSIVPFLNEVDNILVVATYSKSRQLAGGRLGYALGNSSVIADLQKLRFSVNPYNVNSMSLAAGVASLADQAYVDKTIEKIIFSREWTKDKLRSLGFIVTESQTNFVFAEHESIAAEHIFLELRKKNILIRWFNQERIKNFIRISIGSQDEMISLISAIEEIVLDKEE